MKNNVRIDNSDNIKGFIGKGMNFPKPPKKGELMYCKVCGNPMHPKDFSKNETLRKREFKWQIHNKCFEDLDRIADLSVPGLLAERKKMEERQQQG